jgi:hypothetical protein
MGTQKVMRIPMDQADPIYNVGVALENFSGAIIAINVQLIDGMNELLERVERIENQLKAQAAPRRP